LIAKKAERRSARPSFAPGLNLSDRDLRLGLGDLFGIAQHSVAILNWLL